MDKPISPLFYIEQKVDKNYSGAFLFFSAQLDNFDRHGGLNGYSRIAEQFGLTVGGERNILRVDPGELLLQLSGREE